jgi:hypothetical protein
MYYKHFISWLPPSLSLSLQRPPSLLFFSSPHSIFSPYPFFHPLISLPPKSQPPSPLALARRWAHAIGATFLSRSTIPSGGGGPRGGNSQGRHQGFRPSATSCTSWCNCPRHGHPIAIHGGGGGWRRSVWRGLGPSTTCRPSPATRSSPTWPA